MSANTNACVHWCPDPRVALVTACGKSAHRRRIACVAPVMGGAQLSKADVTCAACLATADATNPNDADATNPNDAESARRDRGLPARDGTTRRAS